MNLTGRIERLERRVPVRCSACGRVSTLDQSRTTLILFELDGQLMRADGTHIAREDLAPCPGCRQPKERCGKIIVGVDPAMLFGSVA